MSGVKRYLVTRGSEVSEMVYASDYDRDTQALKDELDNIKRRWGILNSERDELRVQVEVMRKLLVDARRYVDKAWPDGVHSYRTNSVSGDLLSKIDAALQGDKT